MTRGRASSSPPAGLGLLGRPKVSTVVPSGPLQKPVSSNLLIYLLAAPYLWIEAPCIFLEKSLDVSWTHFRKDQHRIADLGHGSDSNRATDDDNDNTCLLESFLEQSGTERKSYLIFLQQFAAYQTLSQVLMFTEHDHVTGAGSQQWTRWT